MKDSKRSPIIPILSWINPVPRFDIYFFKIHSNIIFPSTPRLFPIGLPDKISKELLPYSILATWPAHLNLLELITLTILAERKKLWSFLIVEPLYYQFPSLLSPDIRLRILLSNILSLHFYLNIRYHVSQPLWKNHFNWINCILSNINSYVVQHLFKFFFHDDLSTLLL
jgi:hypothetical protein